MAISDVVKGEVGRVLTITWYQQGTTTPENLTGATLSGTIRSGDGPSFTDTAIAGGLALSDAANGVFTWTLAAGDTDTVDNFLVQFKAVIGLVILETFLSPWTVHDATT